MLVQTPLVTGISGCVVCLVQCSLQASIERMTCSLKLFFSLHTLKHSVPLHSPPWTTCLFVVHLERLPLWFSTECLGGHTPTPPPRTPPPKLPPGGTRISRSSAPPPPINPCDLTLPHTSEPITFPLNTHPANQKLLISNMPFKLLSFRAARRFSPDLEALGHGAADLTEERERSLLLWTSLRTAVDFSLERIFRPLTFFSLGHTRLDQSRPGQNRWGQTRPGQPKSDHISPGQTRPNQTIPDKTRPDKARPDQIKPVQTRSNRAKPAFAVRMLDSDRGSVCGSNVMDSRSCTMYSQNTSAP